MKKLLLSLILSISFVYAGFSQTQLAPGDLLILAYNYDNADQFSFVLLKDIEQGTTISFTDNGWNGSGLTTTEGTFVWVAQQAYGKGAVVNLTPGAVAFSTSGDQIIAYQGNASNPSLVFAFSSTPWVSGTISSTTSRLPSGLVQGSSAFSFSSEFDNGYFNINNTSGSKEELQALVCTASNWTNSNSRFSSFPNWSIQVSTPVDNGGGNDNNVSLTAGDIAIVAFNFDNPDVFSFVTLRAIEAGTEINFTDRGWNGSAFLSTEGIYTWVAPSNITAGTVIGVSPNSVAFGTGGDQIIAYSGDISQAEVIYAFSSRPWVTGSISSSTSRLPNNSTIGYNALAFPNEIDNGFFNISSFNGTKEEALASISNPNNWTRSNARYSSFPNWNFTITGGTPVDTEPSGPATNAVFQNYTSYSGAFSFTPAGGDVEGYLVVRSENAPVNAEPQDGSVYSKGDQLGNSKVIYSGSENALTETGLRASTTYYYRVYSYNTSNAQLDYLQASFLSANATTPASMMGNYYSGIDESSSSFVSNLQNRIKSPYSKVNYGLYDETMVTLFEFRDTTGGNKVQECAYSGEIYVYQPPFVWYTTSPFSREHTWPVSWMPSGGSSSSDEYADQHHLLTVVQNNANGVRSNHPLGEVATPTSSYLEASLGFDLNGNYVYEPRDEIKGDVARSILYTVLRYDGVNGNDWTFNNLNNSILPALNEDAQDLQTLINWHFADLPDNYEIARNDFIQSVQLNRNPFVDHPDWVNLIDFNNLSYISPQARIAAESETSQTRTLSEVKLFPNPSYDDYFFIKSDLGIHTIEIYSITGQKLELEILETSSNNIFRIEAKQKIKGVYFVHVFDGENSSVLRWISK